jgi:cardiolipin synthase
MGGGVGSIVTAIEEMLVGAKKEVHILAYAVSDGAEQLFAILSDKLREGVRVTMIIQRLDMQYHSAPARLKSLAASYPGTFLLFDFTPDESEALHAKCVIADRKVALVGSANLSFNGLIRNHELGIVIEGPAAGDLAGIIEQLQSHPDARRVPAPIFAPAPLSPPTSC